MKGIFSYGDSLKIECSYHLCLQMSLNSELELLPEMLHSVWQETDYRWDVCRITNGSHIEP